jgi:hypothetical protein
VKFVGVAHETPQPADHLLAQNFRYWEFGGQVHEDAPEDDMNSFQ